MASEHFEKWCERASVGERCALLDRVVGMLMARLANDADAAATESALLRLADDPSPKVRELLARRLADDPAAPRRVIRFLCADSDSIASIVVAQTRALSEEELIDLAATGRGRVRRALARRRRISPRLAAALVEVGDASICFELLSNVDAVLSAPVLRRMAVRHGGDGGVAEFLLARPDLPAELRQSLLIAVAERLATMPLALRYLGEAASLRVVGEALEEGSLSIGADLHPRELQAYVEHLRASGQISTAFLLRAVCEGHMELFAAALAVLCRLPYPRTRALVADTRSGPIAALLERAGLAKVTVPLFLAAIEAWKTIAHAPSRSPSKDLPLVVLERLSAAFGGDHAGPGGSEMQAILTRFSAQAAARSHPQRSLRLAA